MNMQSFFDKLRAWASAHDSLLIVAAISLMVVIARRPDALAHPQFWAEDGTIFYANAYGLGVLGSTFLPYAGSLQTLQRIVADFSLSLPLRYAPLLFNVCAMVVQILPVLLLWTSRFRVLVRSDKIRVLISLVYLAIPNSAEVDANITNGNWHLALAAVMILIVAAPTSKTWAWFDRVALTLIGLSGPFAFFLAPVAGIQWVKNKTKASLERLLILVVAALIQVVVLMMGSRPTPQSLGVSAHSLLHIISGQIFTVSILGAVQANLILSHHHAAALIALLGIAILAYCFWKGPWALKILLIYSTLQFVASLIRPQAAGFGNELPWEVMTHVGAADSRYFLAPAITWIICLIWLTARGRWPMRFPAVLLLILAFIVGFPDDWTYPAFAQYDFPSRASAFEHSPKGTVFKTEINPGWSMILVKN
jgi:hypothetical protein